jgi:transketolase N-terminal domain/subunit
MVTTEPEDEKDPKRARVVLSKGHKVVRPGYVRLTGAATKVTDMGENSGNSSRVSRVSQDNHMDQQVDQISRVSQDNSMDRQADRVSRVSQNSSMDR